MHVRIRVLIGLTAWLAACGAAAAQPGSSPDVRVRPYEGMSRAQQEEFETLAREYVEVFRVFGRAQACRIPFQERLKQVTDELEQRHGRMSREAGMTIGIGLAVGIQSEANPFDKPGTPPPTPLPCADVSNLMNTVRLPDVPASLVMRPGDPPEKVRWDETASTGRFRVAVRMRPDGSGPARHVVVHRDQEVFQSADEIDAHQVIEGPTPVVLIGTKHPRRRCVDGRPYSTWHAVTLPSVGASTSARLAVDCTGALAYQGADGQDRRVCFIGEQGQSQVWGVDAAGNLSRRTPDLIDVRACPNLPSRVRIFLK